jgi:predicted MFS family arabinose efflux permease
MQAIRAFGNKTFSSLKVRNYRLYFIGQAISLSGTWMQTVALGWLVLQVTGSGSQLGLVIALQFLPTLFLGPWGGVIVDRVDKRKLLLWAQVGFAFFSGIIGLLIYMEMVSLWMIYCFALCFGLVRVLDNPARQTFVSEMVDEKHLRNAVSLNATANNLARAVGPSIGGLLIAGIGIGFCFLFNAVSYIAVIVMLYLMDQKELRPAEPAPKKKGQMLEGLRYVKGVPIIRDVLIMMAVIGTFAYEFQVSLPIFAQQTFHGNAGDYAALMAAFGVGAVIGGLFAAGRHRIAPQHFVLFALLFGASLFLTSLAPTLQFATIGMVIVGIFSINLNTLGNTMIQLESEPSMRGRVMALWSVAMMGTTPIGGPIVGAIGEHIGARFGLAIGAVATLLAVAYALRGLLRKNIMKVIPVRVKIESDEANIGNIKA